MRAQGGKHSFAPNGVHAATAITLQCRAMARVERAQLGLQADWLAAHGPVDDPRQPEGDPQYLFLGSYAAFQMGGPRHWGEWNEAMKRIVLERPPIDDWDPPEHAGGRLFHVALEALTLEVYFRFARVGGPR